MRMSQTILGLLKMLIQKTFLNLLDLFKTYLINKLLQEDKICFKPSLHT